MRFPFANIRKGGRPRLNPENHGLGPLAQRFPYIARSLKKVNWTKVWHIKNVSREETMTGDLQKLVREFEEKMMVIFQQLVTESEDLKKEVRKLQSTSESQRAENDRLFAQNESQRAENDRLFAQNLKLKNGMLTASERLKDFLQGIEEEANEKAAGKEVAEV
jgi:hypothetical protein